MRLTEKLLGYLNRVFDVDPGRFLAMRFVYDGARMTWHVEDGVLTTSVSGGVGGALSVDLAEHTLASLVQFIAGQAGYTVLYVDPGRAGISARALIDGSGDQNASNGDHFYGYTSLLWALMEPVASELRDAEAQIANLPAELSTTTADGFWLDTIGNLYGIPRSTITVSGQPQPEPDGQYGPRIIFEVLRSRGNNIALELAISNATGGLPASVVDAPQFSGTPAHDSSIVYDGTHQHNATGDVVYGLFDVLYSFDLEGGEDIAAFSVRVAAAIETFRDAGTHLRQITLGASQLADAVPAGGDAAAMTVSRVNFYGGVFAHDSTIDYSGTTETVEALL